jgi:hypothetical protein
VEWIICKETQATVIIGYVVSAAMRCWMMLVHEVRRCTSDVLNYSALASVIQVINRPAKRGSSFDVQRLQALTTRYCTYYSINPLWIQHKSRLAIYFHRFVVLLGRLFR